MEKASKQDSLATQTQRKELVVKKRDGRMVSFEPSLIERAIQKAFCAEHKVAEAGDLPDPISNSIAQIYANVLEKIGGLANPEDGVDVEKVQDLVEQSLMGEGFYSVARRYILYREEHARIRQLRAEEQMESDQPFPAVMVKRAGQLEDFDFEKLRRQLILACEGFEETCSAEALFEDVARQLYAEITPKEIARAMVLAARSRIERDPDYDKVAGRLVRNIIYRESLGQNARGEALVNLYQTRFTQYLEEGIEAERLTPELRKFDWDRLAAAIDSSRDALFPYLGLQTIYDRYLLHIDGRRIEAPQYFWMRVAMGVAIQEDDPTTRAIEFYTMLSNFRFTSATPTLFNAGTLHPQLSSCYLSTVSDDLDHIFKVISDNAKLSKWAGGLGNDWTNIRATNAHIKGTNGRSQGVIPFLKVVSDTAVAVNQGGKRKGAVCSYLETWHHDVEEFLDLRKNTGDERRRTHDMHTANWIPDLFMKRVFSDQEWTLFSPDEVPDLHDLTGRAFEERYEHYEREADAGRIKLSRRIPAVQLWRKMLTRIFETGHPWITWKDPSNLRSPQDHCGVVHSSNLCTEILLNTSRDETAVCNLGSINLRNHITDGKLDVKKIEETVQVAVRMLDNVIDINFYPTDEAENANHRHRPVGLGLMGFQDALAACNIHYASDEAVEFADRSMEAISYHAIMTSSQLAAERGQYSSYTGSKWDRGLLPIDTIAILEHERGMPVDVDRSSTMDWDKVREQVAKDGMRNSNVMAIAPTATISTIIGVTQSIEPTYRHLFVKSNLSGEFTQVNIPLIAELKSQGLWDDEMLEQLKLHQGSLGDIERLSKDLKGRFATSFEIDPKWLLECAARRQKWIDMGQSLNLYLLDPSGRKLDDMYKLAWQKGLKTTYYLRTLAATSIEQTTVTIKNHDKDRKWLNRRGSSGTENASDVSQTKACSIDDPDCEACQ